MQRWRAGGGGLICRDVRNQSQKPRHGFGVFRSDSSLSGYASLNSRNNLCARAFCFDGARARQDIGRRDSGRFPGPGDLHAELLSPVIPSNGARNENQRSCDPICNLRCRGRCTRLSRPMLRSNPSHIVSFFIA